MAMAAISSNLDLFMGVPFSFFDGFIICEERGVVNREVRGANR